FQPFLRPSNLRWPNRRKFAVRSDWSVNSTSFPNFSRQNARILMACPCANLKSRNSPGSAGMISSDVVKQGSTPGGLVTWGRDPYSIRAQSRQLADLGNARHIRDQLVHDRKGPHRRLDRGD